MISILVPLIQTGFLKSKFDSTYPVRLNGIINQNEFQESIQRINRRISSNKILIFLAFVLAMSMSTGILLFIIDAIISNHPHDSQSPSFGHGRTPSRSNISLFSPLIGIGIGLFVFGVLFTFIGCCMIQYQRKTQIQQIIAEESMKYTLRSPIPCAWRFETNRLIIDIGPLNEIMAEPPRSIERGEDNSLPPPYSDQIAAGIGSSQKQIINK